MRTRLFICLGLLSLTAAVLAAPAPDSKEQIARLVADLPHAGRTDPGAGEAAAQGSAVFLAGGGQSGCGAAPIAARWEEGRWRER